MVETAETVVKLTRKMDLKKLSTKEKKTSTNIIKKYREMEILILSLKLYQSPMFNLIKGYKERKGLDSLS